MFLQCLLLVLIISHVCSSYQGLVRTSRWLLNLTYCIRLQNKRLQLRGGADSSYGSKLNNTVAHSIHTALGIKLRDCEGQIFLLSNGWHLRRTLSLLPSIFIHELLNTRIQLMNLVSHLPREFCHSISGDSDQLSSEGLSLYVFVSVSLYCHYFN